MNISTHTPHTGRDVDIIEYIGIITISTHTPHTGRDEINFAEYRQLEYFNSHAPHGARPDTRKRTETNG